MKVLKQQGINSKWICYYCIKTACQTDQRESPISLQNEKDFLLSFREWKIYVRFLNLLLRESSLTINVLKITVTFKLKLWLNK